MTHKTSTIKSQQKCLFLVALCILTTISLFPLPSIAADEITTAEEGAKKGPSGLPIPRYVSLKADRVNVRNGPSTDHKVDWVFRRIGLPVEIIQEFEHWRQVRDSESTQGWVFHSLLSGRRTALITPWSNSQNDNEKDTGTEKISNDDSSKQISIHTDRSTTSSVVVNVEPGVLANILKCDGTWCQLSLNSYRGWVEQEKLWGVYQGEKVN